MVIYFSVYSRAHSTITFYVDLSGKGSSTETSINVERRCVQSFRTATAVRRLRSCRMTAKRIPRAEAVENYFEIGAFPRHVDWYTAQ